MKETGLKDKDGVMICEGNFVSLNGNMTADNSMGVLPNGYMFDEDDVYEVYFDESIENWSLKLDMKPDTRENAHYMNHAVGLLYQEAVKIVDKEDSIPEEYPTIKFGKTKFIGFMNFDRDGNKVMVEASKEFCEQIVSLFNRRHIGQQRAANYGNNLSKSYQKLKEKVKSICPECENPFPHSHTDGSYSCEECGCVWEKSGKQK